jgi:NhaP-type Na+/H+ or K+/H+ antiporter
MPFARRLDENDGQVLILFLFVGVTFGAVINHILSRWPIMPYTVMVFITGLVLGACSGRSDAKAWSESVTDWLNVEPELLLYIFLPPLLFKEAMNLNYFNARVAFPQVITLAGPGVLMGAFMMGGFVYYFLPRIGWPWELCMLFGSILSATDPVAVVALLHEVGASSKLTIQIVGESLMNDGTAMVMYLLYFNLLKGEKYQPQDVIAFFALGGFFAPFVGFFIGGLAIWWLRSLNRPLSGTDVTIQIVVTFITAYLSFFFAQYSIGCSGVLSCCGAGISLAAYGHPLILSHETMHNVWEFAEWMGNTLLFLLAGLIYGNKTISKVDPEYWGYLILLYAMLMIFRFIIVFSLYPILSRTGHGCSIKDAIFISWAGLRGALGIALALVVDIDYESLNITKEQAERLNFLVGGIAAISLVINANTAEMLLNYLGLVKEDSRDKAMVLARMHDQVRTKINTAFEDMSVNFKGSDVGEVKQLCTILRAAKREDTKEDWSHMTEEKNQAFSLLSSSRSMSRSRRNSGDVGDSNHKSFSGLAGSGSGHRDALVSTDMIKDYDEFIAFLNTTFLDMVRIQYLQEIRSGKLPRLSMSAQFLLHSIDKASYHPECLGDWDIIKRRLTRTQKLVDWILSLIHSVWMPNTLMEYLEYRHAYLSVNCEKRAVYMLTSFIHAHEVVQKKIYETLGEKIRVYVDDVVKESRETVEEAKCYLGAIGADIVQGILTKQLAKAVLKKQTDEVQLLLADGLMTPKDARKYIDAINVDSVKIESKRSEMYRDLSHNEGSRRFSIRASMSNRDSNIYTKSLLGFANRIKEEDEGIISPLSRTRTYGDVIREDDERASLTSSREHSVDNMTGSTGV